MAKEDFCFTYYDGDAARDMAHMNRLERGAYSDIIVSQRKFGHLKLSLIKKTLGNDFDSVWESLEIILKKDEEEKFYIEWLDTSILKMKKQSGHQSNNGKKGGRPKAKQKPNDNPNETQTITQMDDKKKPLEDGYGNEDVINSFEKSEKLLIPAMFKIWKEKNPKYFEDQDKDFPALREIATDISVILEIDVGTIFKNKNSQDAIKLRWREIVTFVHAENFFRNYSLSQVEKHFQSILLKKENGDSQTFKPKNGKNAGTYELLGQFKESVGVR